MKAIRLAEKQKPTEIGNKHLTSSAVNYLINSPNITHEMNIRNENYYYNNNHHLATHAKPNSNLNCSNESELTCKENETRSYILSNEMSISNNNNNNNYVKCRTSNVNNSNPTNQNNTTITTNNNNNNNKSDSNNSNSCISFEVTSYEVENKEFSQLNTNVVQNNANRPCSLATYGINYNGSTILSHDRHEPASVSDSVASAAEESICLSNQIDANNQQRTKMSYGIYQVANQILIDYDDDTNVINNTIINSADGTKLHKSASSNNTTINNNLNSFKTACKLQPESSVYQSTSSINQNQRSTDRINNYSIINNNNYATVNRSSKVYANDDSSKNASSMSPNKKTYYSSFV